MRTLSAYIQSRSAVIDNYVKTFALANQLLMLVGLRDDHVVEIVYSTLFSNEFELYAENGTSVYFYNLNPSDGKDNIWGWQISKVVGFIEAQGQINVEACPFLMDFINARPIGAVQLASVLSMLDDLHAKTKFLLETPADKIDVDSNASLMARHVHPGAGSLTTGPSDAVLDSQSGSIHVTETEKSSDPAKR